MAAKILVTEKLQSIGIEALEQKGYQVDVCLGLSKEELANCIADYEAVIIRSSTSLDASLLDKATKLKIIGRAGVGLENVDIEHACKLGIIVCNAPTSNVVSVAEYTFALLLAAARKIPQANVATKQGQWDRDTFTGVEICGKTLALFGLGRTGALIAKRASAFGMNLLCYDPYCSQERAESLGVSLIDSMEEILPQADFITVHLPRNKETLGMFGPHQYAAMKDGVILINASRGGIFNLESMADFIAAGKIGACAIDVFDEEPLFSSALHEFDEAILTPHMGASTTEAQRRASLQIANYIASGLEGAMVPTAVSLTPVAPEVMDALAPYVPAAGFLGSLARQLCGTCPDNLRLKTLGFIAMFETSMLKAALLDGALGSSHEISITPVNAEAVGERHGLLLEVSPSNQDTHYRSALNLDFDGKTAQVTVLESGAIRLTQLFGFDFDFNPGKHLLVLQNQDQPGQIGILGTLLGEEGVNISALQIAKDSDSSASLVLVNTDSGISDELMCSLQDALDFDNLWRLDF